MYLRSSLPHSHRRVGDTCVGVCAVPSSPAPRLSPDSEMRCREDNRKRLSYSAEGRDGRMMERGGDNESENEEEEDGVTAEDG